MATVLVTFALWTGERVKAAAENEASLLQERYAAEIAVAREQGEAALADLQSDFVRRSEVAAEQLTEIGAELAAMSEDRDAVRQELERFIALRDRVGIQLVDFRGRTLQEPCPCCGGTMLIIETFKRGQVPRSRAPPKKQAA